MKTLILDAYNLFHRARSGFIKGKAPIVFNFFRGLRPIVEKISPDEIFLVLEGTPKRRLEIISDYKGTRKQMPHDEHVLFKKQIEQIVEIIDLGLPISIAQHYDHEADDVIAHIARKKEASGNDVVIVSSDTDFIQLLSKKDACIQLYNPMKKTFVEPFHCSYVMWKALRGDGSDNIKGVKGVGDKTATKLMSDSILFKKKIIDVKENLTIFKRNISLIEFHNIDDDEIQLTKSDASWQVAKDAFIKLEFSSMTNDKSWQKYLRTFENVKY